MKNLLFLVFIFPLFSSAQHQLSDKAEIHIITCGPSQQELYSAFGHSAIRVKDLRNGWDLLYNYGVFDFNQPHFYLNFARGHLNYQLAVMEYESFRNMYVYEKRYIHEQVLNLNQQQKQQLFNFLQWNSRPENMHYYYDYFYDNCATRVRDAVKNTFKEDLQFDGSYINTDYTIRNLTDMYLHQQPWGDLGIDLCLGMPMDKKATPWMYMYLPDYIESGFQHATIIRDGKNVPLVKETIITYEPDEPAEVDKNIGPGWAFGILLILGIILTLAEWKKGKHYIGFDVILQSMVGLVGWLLIFLWFFTDHNAAAYNLNVLWAFPLYFPVALLLLRKKRNPLLARFYLFTAILHILVLLGWFILPQDMNNALIPLVILLAIRSVKLFYWLHFQSFLLKNQRGVNKNFK